MVSELWPGEIRSQGVALCKFGWNRQRQGVLLLFLLVLGATYNSQDSSRLEHSASQK